MTIPASPPLPSANPCPRADGWQEFLPPVVEILVEMPRGAFVKRHGNGSIDFVSPLPCPYAYGCIPQMASGDGAPLDALIIGAGRLTPGSRLLLPVVGVVGFVDAGHADPKVVCAARPLTATQQLGLRAFFSLYGACKGALARLRGLPGPTWFLGLTLPPQQGCGTSPSDR